MSLKKIFFSRHNIKMLEITIDNCHKCDLETIIDPNNSQYFWINRRDLADKLFWISVKAH